MSFIYRYKRRGAGALVLLAAVSGTPGRGTELLAACRQPAADDAAPGGCVCAIEAIEAPLAYRDYLRLLIERRRAGLLTPLEIAAFFGAVRHVCGGYGAVAIHTDTLRPSATSQPQREAAR